MKVRKDAGASRLTDITVEEVSLVDRAANNHRFLIVKRSRAMLNGDEDLEPVELGPDEDDDQEAEEAQASGGAGASTLNLEPVLAELRALGGRIDALAKPAPAAAATPPAADPPPAASTPDAGTAAAAALTKAVDTLTETVKSLGQRLARLEKGTGERASVAEARGEPEGVGWPLDMNRPTDRASTPAAVSFHERGSR